MAAFVDPPELQTPPYEAYLIQAIEKANSTAHRVLLRFAKSLKTNDIWPGVSVGLTPGELRIAWADGRRDESFWALGKVAEIQCGHIIRFAQAQKGCSEFCEQIIQAPLDTENMPQWPIIPLGVGGFAFAPAQRLPGEVWSGWEDGVLWVPRLLFYSNLHQSGACITLAVQPGDTLADLREQLVQNLAELESELSRLALNEFTPLGYKEFPSAMPTPAESPQQTAQAKATWCNRVEKARKAIREGDLDKVVLARSVQWEAPPHCVFDAFLTAHRLREEYPTCKVFLIQRPDGSSFVGATPEILVALEGQKIETVSLAGTARRGATPAEDEALGNALVASNKDQHEHRLVTQAIRTSFSPVVESLKISPEPRLLKLQNVQHLETPIEAKLDRTRGIMELVSRLHPTPAVGGTPSAAAGKWLYENEELERGWYAGLLGWVTSTGDGLFAVAIRSALVQPNKAWSFAGAGLVADSDPELEWEETALKLEAMAKSLVVQQQPRIEANGKVNSSLGGEELGIYD